MRNLDRLFKPQSIAVVGASNNQDKVGYHLLYNLRKYPGKLYPINTKTKEIQGKRAYLSFKSIKQPIDIAILCIPAKECLAAIKDAGKAGVAVVFITGGGFGEADRLGQMLQDEIVDACRQYNIRLLGPNTSGFVNPKLGITANFNPQVSHFIPGNIAVVSQSGAMSVVIGAMLQSNRLGVSISIGIGNGPDISVPEVLEYLSHHTETKAIAVYLEGVSDGKKLYETIKKVTKTKPLVVYTVGKSDIGEFAASHTGKLIGSFALKKAALIQAGAVVTSSSSDLVDAVHALSKIRLAPHPNPGVAILTGQAGPAMTITDHLRSLSVNIPELEPRNSEAITRELSVKTYTKNPVDTARPLQQSFTKVLSIIAGDPNIDIVLTCAIHEPMCVDPVKLFRTMQGKCKKPLLFATSGPHEDLAPTLRDLESMDIPAYGAPDRASIATWALVEDARAVHRRQRHSVSTKPRCNAIEKLVRSPDEAQAKAILAKMDIPTPQNVICENHQEAIAAFRSLKKPCVVKVLSSIVIHKTEVCGVHLGVENESQLLLALQKIDAIQIAQKKRYLLEDIIPSGLDIIIGAKNDASFGPTVLLGLGGTAAEAFGDISLRLAPLTVADGMEMICELKTSVLFDAWRGGPNYDKEAVADTLVKIGSFLNDHNEIKEIDLNPVRVSENGIVVLDALIICHKRS